MVPSYVEILASIYFDEMAAVPAVASFNVNLMILFVEA